MTPEKTPPVRLPGRTTKTLDVALRIITFSLIWWVLTQGYFDSWILGVPTVILATLMSLHTLPAGDWHWNIHPLGVLRFVLYFLHKTVISSIDVAFRVMHPDMPLKPGLVEYPYRIKGENARVIMANTTSLLPGTLSVELGDNRLLVHSLDVGADVEGELRLLERRIADMYGIKLEG